MLRKREEADTAEEGELRKGAFVRTYLPELLSLAGRQRFFVDYEFPQKQQRLVEFWGRALGLALRYYFRGCAARWSELSALFSVAGSAPMGLAAVAGELLKHGEHLLVREGEDCGRVLAALRERERKGLVDRLRRHALPSRVAPGRVEGDTWLVSVELLRETFARAEECVQVLFADRLLATEAELLGALREHCALRGFEARLAVGLCLAAESLFRFRERGAVYYHAARLDEETRSAQATMIALERRVEALRPRLAALEETCASAGQAALKAKRAGRKAEALSALQRRRVAARAAESLRMQLLLLEDLHLKLGSAQEQRALAAILRRAGELLRGGEEGELAQGIEEMQEFERGQEELVAQLRGSDGDELEEMYRALEEPPGAEAAGAQPLPAPRTAADEQRRIDAVVRELLYTE